MALTIVNLWYKRCHSDHAVLSSQLLLKVH